MSEHDKSTNLMVFGSLACIVGIMSLTTIGRDLVLGERLNIGALFALLASLVVFANAIYSNTTRRVMAYIFSIVMFFSLIGFVVLMTLDSELAFDQFLALLIAGSLSSLFASVAYHASKEGTQS